MSYVQPRYAYKHRTGLDSKFKIAIVGAGLCGLTLALSLSKLGIASVVFDDDDTVAEGSRAIAFSRHTLEIFGKLGLGSRICEKGSHWNLAKVFYGSDLLLETELQQQGRYQYPAFLNIPQYLIEEWLVDACEASPHVDLRWKTKVTRIESRLDGVTLALDTPDGSYAAEADYLFACDGAHSFIRGQLGIEYVGRAFRDRFLITDVRLPGDYPAERRFWFHAPFNPGRMAMFHRQPDNIWRIDFQLGWDADPVQEQVPENVASRVRTMLGDEVDFEIVWTSVFTFRSRRLENFIHDRVFFVGDSAHQVAPFGGRGGNGGIQDVDNIAWKIAAVLQGLGGPLLLSSYEAERVPAADENILHSTRSADFITPKSAGALAVRDAVLQLAKSHEFARKLVNPGRMSSPATYKASPLVTTPVNQRPGVREHVGEILPDAKLKHDGQDDWLLRHISENGPTLIDFSGAERRAGEDVIGVVPEGVPPVHRLHIVVGEADGGTGLADAYGEIVDQLGVQPGDALLVRPDHYVAGQFSHPDAFAIAAALRRSYGFSDKAGVQ